MFVIDDFIEDKILFEKLNKKKMQFFDNCYNHKDNGWEGTWWKGWWEEEARNLHEELIQYIYWKYNFIKTLNPIKGFEYWTNLHSNKKYIRVVQSEVKCSDFLGWHVNKDEIEFDDDKKVVTPMLSMVMWPFKQLVKGGSLEITKIREEQILTEKSKSVIKSYNKFRCKNCDRAYDRFPIERIEPKTNRLVVFDGSYLHRVTPVESGDRWTFAVDVWDRNISMSDKGIY